MNDDIPQRPGWREIDTEHAAFAGRILDVLRAVVGHLVTGAPMTPEVLRTRFAELIPAVAHQDVGRMPLDRIVADLDEIIRVRDAARFAKTVSIAQAAGRCVPGTEGIA